jgi:hypothetical protein
MAIGAKRLVELSSGYFDQNNYLTVQVVILFRGDH